VREVIEMNENEVEPPPKMGLAVNTDFIRGMAKRDDDFVLILDVEKIFSADELAAVSGAGESAEAKSAPAVDAAEIQMSSF
jgi:purine-binding chemotaxis protein CheW